MLAPASDTALSSCTPFLDIPTPDVVPGADAMVAFTMRMSSRFSLHLVLISVSSFLIAVTISSRIVVLFCPSSPRLTRLTILSFSLAFSLARSDIAMSTLLTSRSAALISSRSWMFSLSRAPTFSVSFLVSSRVFPVEAETSSTFCLMPSSLSLHPLGSTLEDRLRVAPRVPSLDTLHSVFRSLISPLISAI